VAFVIGGGYATDGYRYHFCGRSAGVVGSSGVCTDVGKLNRHFHQNYGATGGDHLGYFRGALLLDDDGQPVPGLLTFSTTIQSPYNHHTFY
jgi:hypothetical protein